MALLRGVNVGKGRRVPMADLRRILGAHGCGEVRTLLNSGNAIFDGARSASARIARDVAAWIADDLHIEVPVVVKTEREFAAIVAECPWASAGLDPTRLLVACAQSTAALQSLRALRELATPAQFHLGDLAAFLYCPDGILASRAADALLGRAGRDVTTRNWATTLKIQALLES